MPDLTTLARIAGGLALELGRTVTHSAAVSPLAAAVTGIPVTRRSGEEFGVPEIACCRSDASLTRG